MKRQIRNCVFETNSSSTHSIAILNGNLCESNLRTNYNNKIEVKFGEFGWEVEDYDDQYTKLQYLITMLAETEGFKLEDIDALFNTDGFKLINSEIASYCGCDGIEIDEEMHIESYISNGVANHYLIHNGYIDHQSTEDYTGVRDFLEKNNTNVIDFVFNTGVIVHTDNDNY